MSDAVQKENALSETNKKLVAAVDRGQQRCAALDAKLHRMRKYRELFHAAGNVECKGCRTMYPSNVFSAHIKLCRELLKEEGQTQGILSDRVLRPARSNSPIQVSLFSLN